MYYHDHCHYQGQNVHEVVRRLEDQRVCDLNGTRIAFSWNACAAIDFLMPYKDT